MKPSFLWNLIGMFFVAVLLEKGLMYITCLLAIKKEGMICTWMDCVISFAVAGISFEFLENIAFGMDAEFLAALFRGLAPAHFVFGVIMGWFCGKYRATGEKK